MKVEAESDNAPRVTLEMSLPAWRAVWWGSQRLGAKTGSDSRVAENKAVKDARRLLADLCTLASPRLTVAALRLSTAEMKRGFAAEGAASRGTILSWCLPFFGDWQRLARLLFVVV